jgi:hypothetical protein
VIPRLLRGSLWDVRLYLVAGGRIQFMENLTNFSLNIGKNTTIQYHFMETDPSVRAGKEKKSEN